LLAIEPALRGLLIASSGGSTASILARAFGGLLSASTGDCGSGPQLGDRNGEVIEVPVNVTEGRLLGELDLDQTIATGRRHLSSGLLARANGRVLYVNNINLLDSSTGAHVAQALDSRQVRVEREGLSAIHDADFRFIGTFNPAEGEPDSLLRDRVGLIVDSGAEWGAEEKVEIIERAFRFDSDPSGFADDFVFETCNLKERIEDARARLPRVRAKKAQLRQISQAAMSLGVEGNRADVFALKAARASAALAGRDAVSEDDLITAVQLVLAPRATRLPNQKEDREDPGEPSQPDNAKEPDSHDAGGNDGESLRGAIEDTIIQALDARVPEDLFCALPQVPRPSRSGKRFKASTSVRGRYVRSAISRTCDARVAIDATLRAAAPFQIARRARAALNLEHVLGGRPEDDTTAAKARRVKIEPGDLRFKEFKHRSGILFIFAVDASGSMALNRMAQAKGALTRLLQQAYLHRDKVALISFRGNDSAALLAPTRSVEVAKRLTDAIPTGGGTPLAAGIIKAIEVARLARLQGSSQTMLVLFTDGRANVSLAGRSAGLTASTIADELIQLGALLRAEAIRSVIVDTRSKFLSNGEGEALARMLGSHYFCLPRSDGGSVYDAIASAARRGRLQTDG
jgi:magnesium chelatase subunit D